MKKLSILALAAAAGTLTSQAAITYVDASLSNTTESDGTAFTPAAEGVTGADNQWETRSFGNGGALYESSGEGVSENAPALVTMITGLTAGSEYQVYSYFWSSNTENWRLKSSLTPAAGMTTLNTGPAVSFPNDPSVFFSRLGSTTSANAPALTVGADSGDNLGVSVDGSGNATGGYFTNTVQIQDGSRNLYQVSLGTATADGSGNIAIYIDDLENTTATNRTWYDGVGYEAVPEPSSAALLGLGGLALMLRRRK